MTMKRSNEKSKGLDVKNNSMKKGIKEQPKGKCDLGPNFIAPDGGWGWVVNYNLC